MKTLLISDFNLQNFAGYLRNQSDAFGEVMVAPFGQVTQTVLDTGSSLWNPKPEICVLWTRPEAALPSFMDLLRGVSVSQTENRAGR
jgi:hypothetical protein